MNGPDHDLYLRRFCVCLIKRDLLYYGPFDFKTSKMKLSLLSGLVLHANAFKLSEKEASQILSRKPRENPQINENSKFFGLVEGADDLERECVEGRAQWIMRIGLSMADPKSGSPWIYLIEPF